MEVQIKKSWVLSKNIKNCYEVWKLKKKRWGFEQSLEVEKKIMASETKYGSSKKKKSWVLSKDIKNCYKVWKRKMMGI